MQRSWGRKLERGRKEGRAGRGRGRSRRAFGTVREFGKRATGGLRKGPVYMLKGFTPQLPVM